MLASVTASAPGCVVTGGVAEPNFAVCLTDANATVSTTRPDSANAPAYSNANRTRSVPNTVTSLRSDSRPRGRCG